MNRFYMIKSSQTGSHVNMEGVSIRNCPFPIIRMCKSLMLEAWSVSETFGIYSIMTRLNTYTDSLHSVAVKCSNHVNVNVKLSQCLVKHYAMKKYGASEGVTPHIVVNIVTRLRWGVSFALLSVYSWYSLDGWVLVPVWRIGRASSVVKPVT
jgi:hypothetical protein